MTVKEVENEKRLSCK